MSGSSFVLQCRQILRPAQITVCLAAAFALGHSFAFAKTTESVAKDCASSTEPAQRAGACQQLVRIATKAKRIKDRIDAIALISDISILSFIANDAQQGLEVKDAALLRLRYLARTSEPQQPTEGLFPILIRGPGRKGDEESGTATLRIVSSGSPPDSSFLLTISDINILDQNSFMQPPIRCLVASGERQIIRVEAESVYRIDAGAGGHFDVSAKGVAGQTLAGIPGPLAWVPIRGKEYLMTISVSLTSPDATRAGGYEESVKPGQGGTVEVTVIQTDDGHVVAHDLATMYY
jgi:hypothetical protein